MRDENQNKEKQTNKQKKTQLTHRYFKLSALIRLVEIDCKKIFNQSMNQFSSPLPPPPHLPFFIPSPLFSGFIPFCSLLSAFILYEGFSTVKDLNCHNSESIPVKLCQHYSKHQAILSQLNSVFTKLKFTVH